MPGALRGKRNDEAESERGVGWRDDAEIGCAGAPHVGVMTEQMQPQLRVTEIARHPKATRDAFTGKVADVIESIGAGLDTGTEAERRRKAVAIYGLMVGTLQLARAVNDKQLSNEMLQIGADEAVALVGWAGN
jgi:hypothetical protein